MTARDYEKHPEWTFGCRAVHGLGQATHPMGYCGDAVAFAHSETSVNDARV